MGVIARNLDRAIGAVAPQAAVNRHHARQVLARYEAAIPNRERRTWFPETAGNVETMRDARTIRGIARDLERNHDLARGAISILVRNVIGPDGVGVEPMPKTKRGEVDLGLADDLLWLWYDWIKKPEVTQTMSWVELQQMMCRTWLRDGEGLAHLVEGNIPTLDHGTRVPFSIEALEPDFLPFEYNLPGEGILQGIERNAWGKRNAYHIYKSHPGDIFRTVSSLFPHLKRVNADRMLHPYMSDRLSQIRGVSLFASVITRLMDIKDYETSERIAAKVAASMSAYIKKGTPEEYEGETNEDAQRMLKFQPGMIFDDLAPGEDIGTIDSNRPNPNLSDYRQGQIQAASRGMEVGPSQMSGNYDGSYSAQRQELVEQYSSYRAMTNRFVARFNRPVWERFVQAAINSGEIKLPRSVDRLHVAAAEFRPPSMPWIDPVKEAKALQILKQENIESLPQMIRDRGGDYRDTLRQQRDARRLASEYDMPFDNGPPQPSQETQS